MAVVSTGFNNWVGVDWTSPNTYSINRFRLYAPNDTGFGSTSYLIEASSDSFVTSTTLYSGSASNSVGEIIDVTLSSASGEYQYFRANFYGDGLQDIAVAQFQLNAVGRQP